MVRVDARDDALREAEGAAALRVARARHLRVQLRQLGREAHGLDALPEPERRARGIRECLRIFGVPNGVLVVVCGVLSCVFKWCASMRSQNLRREQRISSCRLIFRVL